MRWLAVDPGRAPTRAVSVSQPRRRLSAAFLAVKVIVTGSSGLIGSAAVVHWDQLGAQVVGIDNDMRAEFFGHEGSTKWNLERLRQTTQNFRSESLDIRDREAVFALFHYNRR